MGVDISFHIEIRKKEKWLPMVIQTPMELVSYQDEEDKGKEWYMQDEVYYCRYYHFSDFIEDKAVEHVPDDCSEVFLKELSESEMGTGYFMFSDLCDFCKDAEKELGKRLKESRENLLRLQLNRIEKAVTGKPAPKIKKQDNDYYSGMSESRIREEFDDEYCYFFDLRDAIRVWGKLSGSYVADADIRILYEIN